MKKKVSLKTINLNYIIALIPLILYGIYKNGIVLFQKEYVSFSYIFIILLMPFIAFAMGVLIEYIFNKKLIIISSFLPLYGIILSCLIYPGINIFIFSLIIFLSLLLIHLLSVSKHFSLNPLALTQTLIFLIFLVLLKNNYQNIYESSTSLALSLINIIFGRGVGGLFSTNIFLIIIALIYFSFTKLYKKEIPLYMLSTYIILTIIITIVQKDNINMLVNIAKSSVFFASVFIAPLTKESPYTRKGKLTYGVLLGVLGTFATMFIDSVNGVFIAITIGSLFVKYIDDLFALK